MEWRMMKMRTSWKMNKTRIIIIKKKFSIFRWPWLYFVCCCCNCCWASIREWGLYYCCWDGSRNETTIDLRNERTATAEWGLYCCWDRSINRGMKHQLIRGIKELLLLSSYTPLKEFTILPRLYHRGGVWRAGAIITDRSIDVLVVNDFKIWLMSL